MFINCKLAYNGEPFRMFLKSLIKNELFKKTSVNKMNLI